MSDPSDNRDQYSTLEVVTDADLLKHGKYPEVVPSSQPVAYGYYEPAKGAPAAGAMAAAPGVKSITPSQAAPTANTYSTDPEVIINNNANGGDSKTAKICGLPRKWFWVALAAAVLVVIAVVVGAVVGSMGGSGSKKTADNNNSGGDAEGNGSSDNSDGPAKLTLFEDTRLASANFTDAYGNDNFLLAYQMSDASICMSAFNSSSSKWVVSTIINGTGNGIKLGTSLALSTFWEGDNSPDVDIYYQANGSATTIKALAYSSSNQLSTLEENPTKKWESVDATSGFNSIPGSSFAAYGKQCAFCNQYAYLFWEGEQGLFMIENTGDGIGSANLIEVNMEPSTNTSISLAHSPTLTGDGNAIKRRSLNLFYRSKTSGLTQLRIGNGMFTPQYVGRDIGPRTNFAAFATGFNESGSDNPTPLGFQVLSIDPDADDGVQLTYLKGADWTTADDGIEELADCQAKATMAVNTGRRLYCLVESDDHDHDAGVEIVEWAWQGDPSDTSSYSNWERIGAVDVGV